MEEEDGMKDHTQAKIDGVEVGKLVPTFRKQHPGYTTQELQAAHANNSDDVVRAAMALIQLSRS
jgi:hypothetical protein